MKSSRLHRIDSFSIRTRSAFSMDSRLIFLSFSSTKTTSMSAASATAICIAVFVFQTSEESFSTHVSRRAAAGTCGEKSFGAHRRQLVSRLGIVFPDVGFPAIANSRPHFEGSLFSHLFAQKPPDIFNFCGRRERGHRRNMYFNMRLNTGRDRARQFKGNPVISRNSDNLFYSHTHTISPNKTENKEKHYA
jgi:hypothetical protein